ncbi:MAG: ATP-binding protein [Terriglobales bacterium]|jgi:signal transduction histidine kinase
MQSLLWHVTNRTAETLLIFNLFHLLLAGLAFMVLVHQRINRGVRGRPERLITIAFATMVLHFALLTLRFAVAFFLHQQVRLAGLERFSHGLLAAGALIMVAAYLDAAKRKVFPGLIAWLLAVLGLVVIDLVAAGAANGAAEGTHSWATLVSDGLAIAALLLPIRAVLRGDVGWNGRVFRLVALISLAMVFVLHAAPTVAPAGDSVFLWNLQEQLMSLSLFAFTWAVGERSQHLLDRVFVRLNLTFLILASLIMMITAGMEKYQYFRLAEERSVNLAEFLRGHYIYYHERGETMPQIFDHPEVLRRVVAEFGSLPELREVNVYANGQRAAFRYLPDWEVKETITTDDGSTSAQADPALRNSFQMIWLPIREGGRREHIEFVGTLDFVNAYIGKYIIFIYCAFTVMLGLGTAIIGIIVVDTDRQLKRQYAELQQTQQQLAQAAKLASIGELAGGMAHEINNPITSILALSSHMAERENGALTPRSRKSLQTIVKQAERVANLVGGLLSFSRQSQLHIGELQVRELLDTALDLVHFRIESGSIKVVREIPPSLPAVPGDASRLTEVFVNLLTNAVDAMPSGGTLTVRALHCREDGAVRVEVQDTGSGIEPENLPRIFDPFFTTKAPGRGTGLGLSISHGIVKDHGGEIWARSEPGVGTTVVVSLSVRVNQYESACVDH